MKHVSEAMVKNAWEAAEAATSRFATEADKHSKAVLNLTTAVMRRNGAQVQDEFRAYLLAKKRMAEANAEAIGALEFLDKMLTVSQG